MRLAARLAAITPLAALLAGPGPALASGPTAAATHTPAARTASAPEPAAGAAPMAFDWGGEVAVKVVEQTLERGDTATLGYTITLRPDGATGEYVLGFSDFRFVALSGQQVTDEMRPSLGPALALASAIPDIRIGADGKPKALEGFDTMVTRVSALLDGTEGLQSDTKAEVKKMLTTDAMRETLRERMFEVWDAWVGAWVGVQLAPGAIATTDVPVPGMGTAKRVTTHHGAAKGDGVPAGHVTVSRETVLEGAEARLALAKVLAQGQPQGPDAAPTLPEVETFERRVAMRATLAPDTLRPSRVVTEDTRVVKLAGHPEGTEIERHVYTFTF